MSSINTSNIQKHSYHLKFCPLYSTWFHDYALFKCTRSQSSSIIAITSWGLTIHLISWSLSWNYQGLPQCINTGVGKYIQLQWIWKSKSEQGYAWRQEPSMINESQYHLTRYSQEHKPETLPNELYATVCGSIIIVCSQLSAGDDRNRSSYFDRNPQSQLVDPTLLYFSKSLAVEATNDTHFLTTAVSERSHWPSVSRWFKFTIITIFSPINLDDTKSARRCDTPIFFEIDATSCTFGNLCCVG